jgi:hypothetical protein
MNGNANGRWDSDAVLAILAVIAKQERVRLSGRTLAGLARPGSREG